MSEERGLNLQRQERAQTAPLLEDETSSSLKNEPVTKITAEASRGEGHSEPGTEKPAAETSRLSIRQYIGQTLKVWGFHSLSRFITVDFGNKLKVVIFESRLMAAWLATVHILPLAGAAAIASLIYSEHWVGADMSLNGAFEKHVDLAIQVAAKTFELVILASLTTIIFTFVRKEAIGAGLPLAAMFAAKDFTTPAFLWSDGLFALVMARFSSHWKKLFFVSLTVLSCLLAVVVAPATATILQPIKEWRTVVNITANHTLSVEECEVAGNVDCPSAGWERLRDLAAYLPYHRVTHADVGGIWRPPPTYPIDTPRSRIQLNMRLRNPFAMQDGFDDKEAESLMMLPHRASADALAETITIWRAAMDKTAKEDGKFIRGSTLRYRSKSSVASVQSRCQVSTDPATVVFPDPRLRTDDGPTYPNMTVSHPALDAFIQNLYASLPELVFFDTDEANYSDADTPGDIPGIVSIGTLVAVPRKGQSPAIYGCLTNARWIGGRMLYSGQERETRTEDEWPFKNDWGREKVTITIPFANLTNPRVLPSGLTVFQHLAEAANLAGDSKTRLDWTPGHLEAIINGMLVNGMARTAPHARPYLELRDADGPWWRNFFAQRTTVSPDSPYTVFNDSSMRGDPERVSVVHQVHGYNYTWRDDTVRHLMMGLFVYCGVAVLFIVWSLAYGFASTSWESTPELLALAMRSDDNAMPTSVFDDISSLKQPYRLKADDNNDLRLEVVEDYRKLSGDRVKPNQCYK